MHTNTTLSTRLSGGDAAQVSAAVARAVYPATLEENRPQVVIAYPAQDCGPGLTAASLIRPLKGVILAAGPDLPARVADLRPVGSEGRSTRPPARR